MEFQKITPFLWFDAQAQEAAAFYCAIFDNSTILADRGTVVEFVLDGARFIALNGGPQQFGFSEAISFYVLCDDQEEIDRLWEQLTSDGGSEGLCSWCKDRFGVSWQIVPKRFVEMMTTGSPEQTRRVMDAMMTMRKMIIADFEMAFGPDK